MKSNLESIDADLHAAKRDGLMNHAVPLESLSVMIWHVRKSHENAYRASMRDRLKIIQKDLYERVK